MTLKDTENLALELMEKHGLVGWKFTFSRALRRWSRAGSCYYKEKTINLQPSYVEKNSIEEVRNTILHEIAHALMPKHGHNKFWKRKAIEIGCTGSRTYSKNVIK